MQFVPCIVVDGCSEFLIRSVLFERLEIEFNEAKPKRKAETLTLIFAFIFFKWHEGIPDEFWNFFFLRPEKTLTHLEQIQYYALHHRISADIYDSVAVISSYRENNHCRLPPEYTATQRLYKRATQRFSRKPFFALIHVRHNKKKSSLFDLQKANPAGLPNTQFYSCTVADVLTAHLHNALMHIAGVNFSLFYVCVRFCFSPIATFRSI